MDPAETENSRRTILLYFGQDQVKLSTEKTDPQTDPPKVKVRTSWYVGMGDMAFPENDFAIEFHLLAFKFRNIIINQVKDGQVLNSYAVKSATVEAEHFNEL